MMNLSYYDIEDVYITSFDVDSRTIYLSVAIIPNRYRVWMERFICEDEVLDILDRISNKIVYYYDYYDYYYDDYRYKDVRIRILCKW